MNPGELRHRIEVQTNTPTKDSHGGEVAHWATTSTIWAAVETLTGRKLELARQIHAETTVQVRSRLCSDGSGGFDISNRLLFGIRVFEPLVVINEHERNIMARTMCKEGVTVEYE
jgi:SPP1 family predicted phage head-tail adaptor